MPVETDDESPDIDICPCDEACATLLPVTDGHTE